MFTDSTTALSIRDSLLPTAHAGRGHEGAPLEELHALAAESLTRLRLKHATSASAI